MKDTYTASENPSLSELEEDILQHMPRRFKVRGRIQRMFFMCEASKGVEDIFSGNHQLWKPFDAASSVCDHDDTVLVPMVPLKNLIWPSRAL